MKIVEPESSIKNPHAYAARSIRVGRKFPQSKKTLNAYINDAIDFHMIPEVGLCYSENCYGVADALFCLKHGIKPCDIQIENRIYQNDDVLIANPTFEDIDPIIEKIKEFDRVVREAKLGKTA